VAVLVRGGLGAGAIVWGSCQALVQARLKLLVAYSTVAQLGYLFLIFPLGAVGDGGFAAWAGVLLLLVSHAFAKAAMFLVSGNVLRAAGHDRIGDLAGLTRTLPVSMFALGLAGISLVGLPPSGGFAGKWLLLNASLVQGQWWWAAVILGGSLLAGAYVLRPLTGAFRREPAPLEPARVPRTMEWAALGLALVAFGLGFLAEGVTEWLRVGAPVTGPVWRGGGGG
jgi:formate hydrogenlyase subunit 3/multisubunit Na+/H+ antiporter MnhD subunit